MEIVTILFAPMIFVWVVLALAPKGRPFLITLAIIGAVLGVWVMWPVPPARGPDDWFNGIGRAGALMSLATAASVIPAQGVRWWKDLSGWAYIGALVVSVLLSAVVPVLFFSGY